MGSIVSSVSEICKDLFTGKVHFVNSIKHNSNNYPPDNYHINVRYTPPRTFASQGNSTIINDMLLPNVLSSNQNPNRSYKNLLTVTNMMTMSNSRLSTQSSFDQLNVSGGRSISISDFEILKLLGKGTFGKVFLVKNKMNKRLYAMKILNKSKLIKTKQIEHTKTEREILEKITHPFIVKLFYAFQNDENLYLVTEFVQGGELFYHLKKEKRFSEDKARLYSCEIILAIEHLHNSKIIYRDLKPENILLDTDGHIKLADFGLSKIFKGNFKSITEDKAFTLCGTPEYLAPEILMGRGYTKSVDWWSFGILLYEMLVGSSPFKLNKGRRLDLSYYSNPVHIPVDVTISNEAHDLIVSLLNTEPTERLSDPKTIKLHPFYKDINWVELAEKRTNPEYSPKNILRSEDDLSCFDSRFTEDKDYLDLSKLNTSGYKFNNKSQDEIFDKFDYFREGEI